MNDFLLSNCKFSLFDKSVLSLCQSFSCGDSDLDDFFTNDSENYNRQLLGKSYCFKLLKNEREIVCAFTLSNSSIDSRHLPNSRKKKLTENIPHKKTFLSSFPATLIGRLGVNQNFLANGIGTELLEFIKLWLLEVENRTACRFLTVDAYNNEKILKFYAKNGFSFLFSTEEQEKEFIEMPKETKIKTRLMYFDLLKQNQKL